MLPFFELQIISRDDVQIERKRNWPFLLPKKAGEAIQIPYRHPRDFERLIVQSHKHYQVYRFFPRTALKENQNPILFPSNAVESAIRSVQVWLSVYIRGIFRTEFWPLM